PIFCPVISVIRSLQCSPHLRHLRSFPTRRSSDLARIIFKDYETSNWSWDPVAKAYYWHRFFSHQPDLNFDNPAVHAALFKALELDRKSTRLNSSHGSISYAVFCLKKKNIR